MVQDAKNGRHANFKRYFVEIQYVLYLTPVRDICQPVKCKKTGVAIANETGNVFEKGPRPKTFLARRAPHRPSVTTVFPKCRALIGQKAYFSKRAAESKHDNQSLWKKAKRYPKMIRRRFLSALQRRGSTSFLRRICQDDKTPADCVSGRLALLIFD
jgi:hypothetical protein